MERLSKRGTFLNNTKAPLSSSSPPFSSSSFVDQEGQQLEPLMNQTINLKRSEMTLWSIIATCIACLGGFLFGKIHNAQIPTIFIYTHIYIYIYIYI
jgi:hypothetical protein